MSTLVEATPKMKFPPIQRYIWYSVNFSRSGDSGIVREICFEHFGEEQSKYSVDSLF